MEKNTFINGSHGGNILEAIKTFGGNREDWLDLSSGISPFSYPIGKINEDMLRKLPQQEDLERLKKIAKHNYNVKGQYEVCCASGVQSLIQLIAMTWTFKGTLFIREPTYSEYRIQFHNSGWKVKIFSEEYLGSEELKDSILVAVNPNNPDGFIWNHHDLVKACSTFKMLIIDESFVDPTPQNSFVNKMCSMNIENVIVLRSFGKFYGLAGVRLGFAMSSKKNSEIIRTLLGPWPVSNLAIYTGINALSNVDWQANAIAMLSKNKERLDSIAALYGWTKVGGTHLFSLYQVDDPIKIQHLMAEQKIWTRIFQNYPNMIRLGIPGSDSDFIRLEKLIGTLT